MNTPKSRKSDGEDVESLAHDLLGVDLNATDDDDEPLEVDGLGLDDLGFGPEEASEIVDDEPESVVEETDSEDEDDPIAWLVSASKKPRLPLEQAVVNTGFGEGLYDEDDFGPEIDEEDPSEVAEFDEEEPEEVVAGEANFDSENESDEDDDSEEMSERDAYWDALDDNAPKRKKPKAAPKRRRPKTKRVKEEPAEAETEEVVKAEEKTEKPKKKRRPKKRKPKPAAPVIEQDDDDDGFGSGLFDGGSSSVDDSAEEEFYEEEEVIEEEFEVEEVATRDDDEFGFDDFGAGLELEDEPKSRPKTQKRRPPQRKKVKREAPPEKRSRSKQSSETPARSPKKKSQPKKKPEEAKDRYADIPTWDEAISFLDTKKQKSSSGKRSGGGGGQRRGRGRRPQKKD